MIMPANPEEDTGFLNQIRPLLNRLEELRKKKRRNFQLRVVVGVIFLLLAPNIFVVENKLLGFMPIDPEKNFGMILFFFLCFLVYRWVLRPRRDYHLAYKDKMLPQLAGLFGDFSYKAGGRIPNDILDQSLIIPGHERNWTEDLFEGEYKGTGIQFLEMKMGKRRWWKRRESYKTVFKGLVVLISLPENKFFGHTIICKDVSSFLEWFKEKGTGFQKADLIDPDFEKQFDVYTNDQMEARYLLDPAIIERIKALSDIYETESISAAFYKDKMLVLIPCSENLFEPPRLEVEVANPVVLLKIKKEINHILHLIDLLKLYDANKAHKVIVGTGTSP